MGNLLYALAVIFIIIWAIGFLAYHVASGLIYLLLAFAVIAILLRAVRGRKRL